MPFGTGIPNTRNLKRIAWGIALLAISATAAIAATFT